MRKSQKKKPLGRPAGACQDQVRNRLLDAARELFLSYEFHGVSVRQITDLAHVNPAMVNYYFGSKQGLYMAMVDDLFNSLEQDLAHIATGGNLSRENSSEPMRISIKDFSSSYCHLLARNPWWPNFIVREVLFSEGEMRTAILERFTSIFAPRLLHSIQCEIAEGNFRSDLNPGLTLMSLMGMTVFPFLAKPLLETVLKLDLSPNMVSMLAAHNAELFLHGVENSSDAGGQ